MKLKSRLITFKKVLKNKPIIFLVLLLLVVMVDGTIAYFSLTTKLDNRFNTSKYDVRLSEDFDSSTWPELTKKKVSILNDGTADIIVRMSYNEMWRSNTGDVLNNIVDGKNVVIKDWATSLESDWLYKDGWYYYKKIIEGKSELQLLNSIMLDNTVIEKSEDYSKYLTYEYSLIFNYESIQATSEAVKDIWGQDIEINDKDITWNV